MKVVQYIRPNGIAREVEITEIKPEDRKWFKDNNVKVSFEEDNSGYVILYGDIGQVNEDGEPDEVIEIVKLSGMSCNQAMTKLRQTCEIIKNGIGVN